MGTLHDDTVTGATFETNMFAGFGGGADKVTGGYFDDVFTLLVDEKTDTIDGGNGHDRVDYSQSDRALTIDLAAGRVSAIFGGTPNNALHGAIVADLTSIEDATGSNFNDTIIGTGNFNTIDGGWGNDILDGGGGINTVSFVSHDLLLFGANEQDNIALGRHGADGNADVIARPAGSATLQLLESDTLRNFQNVTGSNHGEGISGNEQDNTINGRGGNDVINGFEGNDTLIGGDGNDRLIGSSGADMLTGGKDSDSFIFMSVADSPNAPGQFDVISDFEHGVDKINLAAIDANVAPGIQHFSLTDAEILDAGEVNFFYDTQHDLTVVQASTTGADVNFHLQLFGHVGLTASDFIL
jgi:Ca2+-binding RTX toxin-like protein